MSHDSNSNRQPLTLSSNILYGVGSIAFGVHVAILSSALMLYYNQVVGLPAAWVGAAIMITLIFDAICDPLIGEWSDHTRSRWGRRHPFMYASAVPGRDRILLPVRSAARMDADPSADLHGRNAGDGASAAESV